MFAFSFIIWIGHTSIQRQLTVQHIHSNVPLESKPFMALLHGLHSGVLGLAWCGFSVFTLGGPTHFQLSSWDFLGRDSKRADRLQDINWLESNINHESISFAGSDWWKNGGCNLAMVFLETVVKNGESLMILIYFIYSLHYDDLPTLKQHSVISKPTETV